MASTKSTSAALYPSQLAPRGYMPQIWNSSDEDLESTVLRLAEAYFAGKPGHGSLASNVALHGSLGHFKRGWYRNKVHTLRVLNVVIYRLNEMTDADEYVFAMGLQLPSCYGYDLDESMYRCDPVKKSRWSTAWNYQIKRKLLPSIMPFSMFREFAKPSRYLAFVLAELCETESEIMERIDLAVAWKEMKSLTHRLDWVYLNDDQDDWINLNGEEEDWVYLWNVYED